MGSTSGDTRVNGRRSCVPDAGSTPAASILRLGNRLGFPGEGCIQRADLFTIRSDNLL